MKSGHVVLTIDLDYSTGEVSPVGHTASCYPLTSVSSPRNHMNVNHAVAVSRILRRWLVIVASSESYLLLCVYID